jgi:hypothetical protein
MATKRPNLAALAEAAGSLRAESHRAIAPANEAERLGEGPDARVPSSRIGQKPITAFFPEAVRIQLKIMAAEQARSMESLIGEALNDLFAKHGKPEIVPAQDISH